MVKQETLNEKQQMLLKAWNQLNNSVELNIHLQEEITRRDSIVFFTFQKFFSFKYSLNTFFFRF